jgi:Tol biopolymer transport system component
MNHAPRGTVTIAAVETRVRAKRLVLAVTALALTVVALPPAAGAVLAGPNGKVLFTSGRDDPPATFTDANAQIWIVDQPGGLPMRITANPFVQHRHSSWAPDGTKLAYAAGAPGDWDIWIQDLTKPASATNPVNITNTPGVPNDRPAWSPDGTRIAYTAVVGGVKNVFVQGANGISQLSAAAALQDADKPAWSPDSQTIFYSFDVTAGAPVNNDILREPAGNDNGAGATGVVTGATDDYQPAVSPDGQSLCFTRGAFGTTMATVQRSTVAGAGVTPIANSGVGDYNCAWSPDATKIAYVNGIFGNGALVMKNADGSGLPAPVVNDVPARFDGNPDWFPNRAPSCQATSVTVNSTSSVSIPLSCSDPPPESSLTSKSIVTAPAHGTLGAVQSGQPAHVTYTPSSTFSGTDSFTFRGSDGTSNSAAATVSIVVKDTRPATISSVSVSPSRWRLGSLLPGFFSRRRLAPVGTNISFRLDESATVRLTFALKATGRRVNRVCKAPTRSRRKKPRCTRYLTKGSITSFRAAGRTRVRFQGRLSRSRRLGRGSYRVTISAVDAAGNASVPRTAFFTIVKSR